jgi:hypothetical protein
MTPVCRLDRDAVFSDHDFNRRGVCRRCHIAREAWAEIVWARASRAA